MTEAKNCCGAARNKIDLRRERVSAAARKLFIENGFHGTGIAQIAKESGVAVGQLYRDFSAKEDIVAAIVATDCSSFMAAEALRLAIRDGDEAKVRQWIHQFVAPEDDPDDARLFAEILAEAGRNRRIAAIFDSVHSEVRALMLNALDMLAPGDGLAGRRAALADTVLTMSLGLMHHQLVRPTLDVLPLARAFAAMVDRDIDALRKDAAAIA